MPPVPTPTTSDEASLLFYVLLILVAASTIISMYALYRTARKTASEESGARAGATETLQRVIASMGTTYDDLVSNVRETVEIQLRAEYREKLAEMERKVNILTKALETYEIERKELRALVEQHEMERGEWRKLIESEIEQAYRAEIEELRRRVSLIEAENNGYRLGLGVLLAQMNRAGLEPEWKPADG